MTAESVPAALQPRIPIDSAQIAEFCRRWNIAEFSLFGSVLRDDFRPDSDVDVLVRFGDESARLDGDYVAMHEELQGIFGRKVDLVDVRDLKNPYRRSHILRHKQIIYAA